MVNSVPGVFLVPEEKVSCFYCNSIFTLGMALECAGANPRDVLTGISLSLLGVEWRLKDGYSKSV